MYVNCFYRSISAESHFPKRWWRSQNVSFAGSRVFHGSRSERGVLSIAPHLVLSLQKCLRNPSMLVLNACHLSLFGDTPSWNEVHSCLFSLNKEMDFICTKCVAWYVACACMCRILPRGTQPNPSWGARRQTNTCYTMFVTCSGLRRRMFRISEMGALAMLLALSFAAKRISSSICGTWCNIPYQHGVTCDTVP